MSMGEKPKTIDLFCGAGGLTKGFEMAGFDVLMGVDVNESFLKTFEHNFPGAKAIETDIRDLKGKNILEKLEVSKGEIDVVVGGPPCKGFSFAGERDPEDERNNLVWHFIRLVDELRPKWFLMENVKGLLSMETPQGVEVPEKIMRRFADIGYKRKYRVLNSAKYGVPQKRRRVIFLGNQVGNPINYPEPTHRAPDQETLKELDPYKTVREALKDVEDVPNHVIADHSEKIVKRMDELDYGESVYDNWSDSWVRFHPDKPSPTIKENHAAPGVHPFEPRVLSPRECARLQSFPDDFVFKGSKSSQFKQIGNAVPPLLAKALALEIKKHLD